MMIISSSLIYSFLSIAFISFIYKQNFKGIFKKKYILPPGSMGWPYIGETHQFYKQNPNVFFLSKQKRYGEIFKTHLLGCPSVMLTSPEAARFVLVTQADLFKPTYPKSKEKLIGPSALFFHQGDYHARIRKLVLSSLTPEYIRGFIPNIEKIVISMLNSWDGHLANTYLSMKMFSFDVAILAIFGGQLEEHYKQELRKNFTIIDKGYNSFPIKFPGTSYNKAILARKEISRIFSGIMSKRRENGVLQNDLLGCFLNSRDGNGEQLSDDQILDNVIGVLFAAQDTTASVLTWIVKYLHDDVNLLEAVRAEQMAIYELNERGRKSLTWTQTRSMTLTHRVILESLRMASVISFTFREAVADVDYKGFVIPKGWKVMPLFRNIHHNPELFPDPQKFDPSRFLASPKPNTFWPFGNGVHSCPGNELAKLEMFIFIHHLLTKYRLEVRGSHNEIEYRPFPVPKNGLPAIISRLG